MYKVFCDRCGHELKNPEELIRIHKLEIEKRDSENSLYLDLCTNCEQEIYKFIFLDRYAVSEFTALTMNHF